MAINSGQYYQHPQETWDEKTCKRLASHKAKDGCGTPYPWPGYLGSSASFPPTFGRIRYNGGCHRQGDWWEGEEFPLPKIPPTYVIIVVPTWGWRIVRATKTNTNGAMEAAK